MIGLLLDAYNNGLRIEFTDEGYGVRVTRVANGVPSQDYTVETVKDVYDPRQGNMVSGFEISDARGYPTGEVYLIRDFQMSGNLPTNRIEFL